MIPIEPSLATDIGNNCTIGKVLEFAAANNLIITEAGEFNKFTITIFVVGAIVGIIAWELFKYTYRYGKQHPPKNP
jgi:hypothetical protein